MLTPIATELLSRYAVARGALLLGVRMHGIKPADEFQRRIDRREFLDAHDDLLAFLRGHCPGATLECGRGRRVSADQEGGLQWAEWSRWPTAWRAYLCAR